MANKVKERARLLKLYRQTGDEEYRNAAEALKIPLLDHLKQLDLYAQRRRGRTVGKEVGPRLYRMHKLIAGGMTVHAAAWKELRDHGHHSSATEHSQVRFLCKEYAEQRERIIEDFAFSERVAAPRRQFERSVQQSLRTVQASMPPAWLLNMHARS
jgi:hypothetical protein